MKNLMNTVRNALGMRAEVSDIAAPGCGTNPRVPSWRWYLYHSM